MKIIMNTRLKHDRTFADIKPGSEDRPEGGTHGWAGMKSEDIAAGFDQEQQAPTAESCVPNVAPPRASSPQSLNPPPSAVQLRRTGQPSTLNQFDWQLLLKQTERFARRKIGRSSWRGQEKGVLPGGYDATSIAAEAVADFLASLEAEANSVADIHPSQTCFGGRVHPSQSSYGGRVHPPQNSSGGQPPSLLRDLDQEGVRKELRRRARLLIDRLRHRKENRVCRNEEDLGFVAIDGNEHEIVSFLETIPGPDPTPPEIIIANEEAGEWDTRKQQFVSFLAPDTLLQNLFACLCAGISNRAAIARKLGVTSATIKNAQRRFARRVAEFQHVIRG